MIALIDGDILAWKAAATTERTEYAVGGNPFRYFKEAAAYCDEQGLERSEIERILVEEPFEITESNCRSMMDTILTNTGATEYRLFLTGKDNYREAVAKTRPYKGNRTKPKPKRLPDTKQFLVNEYGAETVDGCEADDMLGILQGEDTVICSIDKDLRCIPGKHYHLDKQELTEVSEHEAWWNFWFQVLKGDTSDNIEGLAGCGEVGARETLGDLDESSCSPSEYATQLRRAAEQKYRDVLGEPEWEPRLREMATLVWIQQDPGDSEGWDRGTTQES